MLALPAVFVLALLLILSRMLMLVLAMYVC